MERFVRAAKLGLAFRVAPSFLEHYAGGQTPPASTPGSEQAFPCVCTFFDSAALARHRGSHAVARELLAETVAARDDFPENFWKQVLPADPRKRSRNPATLTLRTHGEQPWDFGASLPLQNVCLEWADSQSKLPGLDDAIRLRRCKTSRGRH